MVVMVVMVVMIVGMSVIAVLVVIMVMPIDADAADMQVMAHLRRPLIGFVADDLRAIFAQVAVHQVFAGIDLGDALGQGVEHQRMVVEVVGLDELDLRMGGCGASVCA